MGIRKLNWLDVHLDPDSTMTRRIAEEILRPDEVHPSSQDAPVVLQEKSIIDGMEHYFVIWDEFGPVDPSTRSLIIQEALSMALGDEAAFSVASAVGLTREEADKVGLRLHESPPPPVSLPIPPVGNGTE
jgi:hypothetical protein